MPECTECFSEDRPLHPDGLCNQCKTFSEPDRFKWEPRGDFKFEASYGGPLDVLVCLGCGSDRFIVGRKAYHTAAKCEKCGWERCIHDG
jgi:hypothetical protein